MQGGDGGDELGGRGEVEDVAEGLGNLNARKESAVAESGNVGECVRGVCGEDDGAVDLLGGDCLREGIFHGLRGHDGGRFVWS